MTSSPDAAEKVVAELRAWSENDPNPEWFGGDVLASVLASCGQAAALIESQRATIESTRTAYEQMNDAFIEANDLIAAAEARVAALEAALKPFARAAKDCDVEDDIRIGVVKPADIIWESAAAASITFGHLNTAAQALSRSSTEVKNDG